MATRENETSRNIPRNHPCYFNNLRYPKQKLINGCINFLKQTFIIITNISLYNVYKKKKAKKEYILVVFLKTFKSIGEGTTKERVSAQRRHLNRKVMSLIKGFSVMKVPGTYHEIPFEISSYYK